MEFLCRLLILMCDGSKWELKQSKDGLPDRAYDFLHQLRDSGPSHIV